MSLFRKFFYRKPPDGLLEITERVYVFDSCFSTDVFDDDKYGQYTGDIVLHLRSHFADASFMVFNFREEERESQQSLLASILSIYDMVVMDYPRHYVGCPLLTMEMIHHFLRSGESWLSMDQHNVLIMHCERGGWNVLAFMLAGLLLYRKQFMGEQRTLEMVYRQAPRELIQLLSPLNPMPSQIRYLHYICRRNVSAEWPPGDRPLTLDCVILRNTPGCNGEDGCRPIFRIYGQDPLLGTDNTPKVLFSTPKRSKYVRHYKRADCELIKIDIHCHIQGDVVLECISMDADQEQEEMMFRVMFNTAFIRSNILMLNRDEIDIMWDAKDRFPKEFRAEILFSEMDTADHLDPMEMAGIGEKEGLPIEAFAKVQEMFSIVDWLDPKGDAAVQFFQRLTTYETIQLRQGLVSPSKKDLSIRKEIEHLELGSPTKTIQLRQGLLSPSKKDSSIRKEIGQLKLGSPTKNESDNVQNKSSNAENSTVYMNKKECDGIRKFAPLDPASIYQGQLGNSVVPENINAQVHKEITHVVDITTERSFSLEKPDEQSSPVQCASPSMIMSQRFPLSRSSSAFPSNSPPRSLSACPRFFSVPSALGITALLEDHATFGGSENCGSTIIAPTMSDLSSATIKVPSKPSSGQHPITGTPIVTKGMPPPAPSPPPPPQPSGPVLFVASDAFMLSEEEDDLSKPSPKHSVRPPAPPPPPPVASTSTAVRPAAPPPPPTPPLASTSSPIPPAAPPPPLSPTSSAIRSSAPLPPPPPPPGITSTPPPPNHSSKQSPPAPPPPHAPRFSNDANHPGASGNIVPPPAPPGLNANLFGTKGRGPAPPSGPMSKSLQSGQTMSRRSNLKPLHWVKVTRAMKGSLWAEGQKADEASKAPVFDMSELENLFSTALPNSNSKRSDKSGSRASGAKPEKIHLIDLRRANNCGIMLTKVKMPLPDLMSAILALDDTVLDADQVENLIKFTPTKEEIELLRGYKGDKQDLGECEQFFMELMKLPRVDSKLRVFLFKIQFRSQVSDLKRNLNVVNSSAEEIRGSVKLKRIMQTILSLGNALNQGTARGSAVGFRLDSLLKLSDTRARNNKMTLMHYLSKVLSEKLPELLDFPKDLASLELAAKIQLKSLAEEMQAINKGLEKVEQELTISENDGPVSEIFCKTLKGFLSGAEAEVRALTSLYSNVGRNADALALYFGEDPARCPFEQVVTTLHNFVKLFTRSHEENCKQLDLEKKKALKEAEAEPEKAKGESENEKDKLSHPIKELDISLQSRPQTASAK
ncbi:unnamed protein product [Triticum turgidum subsp. durum]|uniref:Formin-like protein n=1 Tax=Triticum turgidum subsp. durum TaxID=4567 RepID=A0A9R0V4D1_TRITD|nr:unnamed protein product [Triticum turgidum subsp. durum]